MNEQIVRSDKRLGKLPAKSDPRQLRLSSFLGATAANKPPDRSEYWESHAPFPPRSFGNRTYGDCTRASQAVLALRMERRETKHTARISDDEITRVYFEMTEREYGGGDVGAYETDALDAWRRPEQTFRDAAGHPITIDAYTRVNHIDLDEVRWAIHLSGMFGIKVCFNLPAAWADIAVADPLDAPPGVALVSDLMPGSWGGHSTAVVGYTPDGVKVAHTWYDDGPYVQLVTWRGFAAYADEAYSVVDSVDAWRRKPRAYVNADAIVAAVNEVSSYKIKVV